MSEEAVEILPADEGARPWLHEKEGVPVLWDGDYAKRLGTARLYAKDGALMADISLDGPAFDEADRDQVREMLRAGRLSFGVNGQSVEHETRDGVQTVTKVDPLFVIVGRPS